MASDDIPQYEFTADQEHEMRQANRRADAIPRVAGATEHEGDVSSYICPRWREARIPTV
jgi:hypothetical protein